MRLRLRRIHVKEEDANLFKAEASIKGIPMYELFSEKVGLDEFRKRKRGNDFDIL